MMAGFKIIIFILFDKLAGCLVEPNQLIKKELFLLGTYGLVIADEGSKIFSLI